MAYTDIDDPSAYFQTVLWTGNATDDTTISGVGFQSDWTWFKERSSTSAHTLQDSVRGATKQIFSNATDAEATNTTKLKSWNSDGFIIGTSNAVNQSSQTYVAWNWKETATAGFDIVSYTGNATVRTISHSLSAVPKMIIVKNRSNIHAWRMYHASLGATHDIYLSSTDAKVDSTTPWNDTEPTSSVFTVGTANGTNQDGDSLIAYLFAEKQGYSKFGSYTGNGNADGTFVYTGFKPAWVMIKRTDSTGLWSIYDNKRHDAINSSVAPYLLRADSSDNETTDTKFISMFSNGFKIKTTSSHVNASGGSYLYMALAEQPLVTSSGVPATAR